MKILNMGSLNIDNVYRVKRLVLEGETISSDSYQVFAGGKGLNQSIALVKAGAKKVYHAGNIGTNGDFLMYTLLEYGVNTKYIRRSKYKAGHAVIQVEDSGNHTIITHGGSNQVLKKSYIDQVFEDFQEGDLLVLQNEVNYVGYMIEKGWEKGMKIIFNPAPANQAVLGYDLSKIDTIIINDSELYTCTNAQTIEEGLSILQEKKINILLTFGKQGGTYYSKDGQVIKYQAYKVDEIDTTGVGDVFVGYFVAGLAQGEAISAILKRSSKAAALSATQMGASTAIPTLEEVCNYTNESKY